MAGKVYTVAEAAAFVGVSEPTIRRAVEGGELKRIAMGGQKPLLRQRTLIDEGELTDYRERLKQGLKAAARRRETVTRPAAGARA